MGLQFSDTRKRLDRPNIFCIDRQSIPGDTRQPEQ